MRYGESKGRGGRPNPLQTTHSLATSALELHQWLIRASIASTPSFWTHTSWLPICRTKPCNSGTPNSLSKVPSLSLPPPHCRVAALGKEGKGSEGKLTNHQPQTPSAKQPLSQRWMLRSFELLPLPNSALPLTPSSGLVFPGLVSLLWPTLSLAD